MVQPVQAVTRMRWWISTAAVIALSLGMQIGAAQAQTGDSSATPALQNVLYGAAYYHEYMPYDRLDKDIALMKEAGLNVVRMGESTWSLWEPADGHFEYAWMDRVVDAMGKAGIKVIMGTPTYSIPTWLYHQHPEVLARPLGGAKTFYGMRQNMDTDSPVYRFYCERVIRNMVEHYKDNPTVIGWQLDNENVVLWRLESRRFPGFPEPPARQVRRYRQHEQGVVPQLLGRGRQ